MTIPASRKKKGVLCQNETKSSEGNVNDDLEFKGFQ